MEARQASSNGRVLVVGSANLDIVGRAPRHPNPGETLIGTQYAEYAGGKGLNQAVAASRAGAPTSFIAALGDDTAGATLRSIAVDSGVDVAHLQTIAGTPTGRALIVVDDDGENTIIVIPGANARCEPSEVTEDSAVVLAQLEIPTPTVAEMFRRAKSKGARTVLNPAPAAALPPDVLRLCDIVIPNEHEVELLGGVDALHAGGVHTVIVTRGADGIEIFEPNRHVALPAFAVTAIDTTGAGDAFCGSLCAALAGGADIDESSRFAMATAAIATTRPGAVPSMPTRDEVIRFIQASAD